MKMTLKTERKPVTEAGLRRLLRLYREADELKAKQYAIDPYGLETHKAFALADRRYVAFYRVAERVFGSWIGAHKDIQQFMENNLAKDPNIANRRKP